MGGSGGKEVYDNQELDPTPDTRSVTWEEYV